MVDAERGGAVNERDVEELIEHALDKARDVFRGIQDREQISDLLGSICSCPQPKPMTYMGERRCLLCRREIVREGTT